MFSEQSVIYRFRGPFGIEVQVSSSLAMLAGFIVIMSARSIAGLEQALIFITILLASIYLHELGHGWAALVQRVPVRRIVLHGGGGFCERTRSASVHEVEFITAMGPLVNLTIWALASLGAWYFSPDWALYGTAGFRPPPFWLGYLQLAAWLNLALFIFNLLPVHPLDGGKLFQLALRRVLPGHVASRISGWVGLTVALLWWPALVYLWFTTGWVLFFVPSIRQHWHMAHGGLV